MSLDVSEDQINIVVNNIINLLNGRKLTQSMLIRVIANCMLITSRMKIQNSTKKKIVINAIERYIKQKSDLNQDEINLLMSSVDILVSDAIDVIADVSKGLIKIKQKCVCL